MGSKQKTTTNQTQATNTVNTYGWQQRPETADTQALRAGVTSGAADPGIAYAFGRARQVQDNSFRNPMGAYTTAAVRDAASRAASKAFGMDERVAAEQSRIAGQERRFQQLGYVNEATAPVLVQTGGSSTGTMSGTQVQQYNPGIGSYISTGLGVGASLL